LLALTFAQFILRPVLSWPFASRQTALDAILIYIAASFILPLWIGLMTNTDHNATWRARQGVSPVKIRLYTYQGAFIGFHLGYFAIFAIHLIMFYFQVRLSIWFQFALAAIPLWLGAMGAHVAPDNFWRAYKRLWLSDGALFFVFMLLGPVWGWFFLQTYPWLLSSSGALIIIISLIFSGLWIRRINARAEARQ
jgi:hypothetical protein